VEGNLNDMSREADDIWRSAYTQPNCYRYMSYAYEVTYEYFYWFTRQRATVKYPVSDGNPTRWHIEIKRDPPVSFEPAPLTFYCTSSNRSGCDPKTLNVINRSPQTIALKFTMSSRTPDMFTVEGGKTYGGDPQQPVTVACDNFLGVSVEFALSSQQQEANLRAAWSPVPPATAWVHPPQDIRVTGKVFP
jgi:hypothetical protein